MKYFDTLPKIIVTENGNSTIRTNLLSRSSIIPGLFSNPMVFYDYDIQEGDTPEIIAFKYYGDVYRYWLVLLANQIVSPQWDWPMTQSVMNDFLDKKYPNIDIYTTIDHYEKTITTVDNYTNSKTVDTIAISQSEYSTLIPESISYKTSTIDCVVSQTARPVSVFEMENEKNELKRSIKLLNSGYVNQIESEIKKLFKQ
jgi:hypothetical protein